MGQIVRGIALLALLFGADRVLGFIGACEHHALAAPPGTQLTVQVGPAGAGIPCDIGPPIPANSVPVEAQQMGMTHCALNADLSQPAFATPAWVIPSNATLTSPVWADCFGESADNPNVLWHSGSSGIRNFVPCNIAQRPDPASGVLVMDFQWLPVYNFGSRAFGGNGQANQVSMQTYNNWTRQPTFTVGNYFVETVDRILPSSCPGCTDSIGGPNDVYMWGYWNNGNMRDGNEIDVQEFDATGGPPGVAAGNCNYCAGGAPYWSNWGPNKKNLPARYSLTDYHAYGAGLTSDGKTSQIICMFIDHILQNDTGCQTMKNSNGSVKTDSFNNRSWVIMGASSNSGEQNGQIDFLIQYLRVFSCDGYKTSQCNGTRLSNTQLPTGQSLTYWH